MFGLGIPEIVVILLAVGVLLFGGKKVVELSRSLGRASGEFKKGKRDIERELKEAERAAQDSSTDTDAVKMDTNDTDATRS